MKIIFATHPADEGMMRETAAALRGELLDPLKTVVVHGARSMAVWCLRKV